MLILGGDLVPLRTRDMQITVSRQTLIHRILAVMCVDLLVSRRLMIRKIS